MAFASVAMTNPVSGETRTAPVGFSWTVFFFGFFPPLFRSDWKWAVILFLIGWLTVGFSNLVFSFLYNKLYLKDLIAAGFKAQSTTAPSIDGVALRLGVAIPTL